MIAFVDLEEFFGTYDHLANQTANIQSTCDERFDHDDSCVEWMGLINQRMQRLQDKLTAMGQTHVGSKRAVFDFVGNLAGVIFGVLDSRIKREYEVDIKILYHLSVPLLYLNEFNIVPVPFARNGTLWVIDTDHKFLIVSDNRRTYQFTSENSLQECLEYDGELVCSGPSHWHTNNMQQCEWNIFNQKSNAGCTFKKKVQQSFWFSVGGNKWFFSCRDPQALTFICTKQVIHSGLLTFDQNCSIASYKYGDQWENN